MDQGLREEGRGFRAAGAAEKMRCSRCGAEMEEGFLLDGAGPAARVSSWVPGRPERGAWFGLQLKGRKQRKVGAFRCTKCGLLEMYAL